MKKASIAGLFFWAFSLLSWASPTLPEPVTIREFAEEKPLPDAVSIPLRLPKYALQAATWPIKSLVALNEEYDLVERALDFFSFDHRTIWLYPTLTYSSSDSFSFGGEFKNYRFLDSRYLHLQAGIEYNLNREWDVDLNFYNRRHLQTPGLYSVELDFNDNRNEKFYGLGVETDETFNETVFRLKNTAARMDFGWHPSTRKKWLLLFSAGYRETFSGSGRPRDNEARAEEVFPEITELSFGEELSFAEYGTALAYDSREPEGFPHRGGFFNLGYLKCSPLDGNGFAYNQIDVKVASLINLGRKNRVLALAFHYRSVEDAGREVPFYQLAGLGKNTFLRGYPDNRFLARKALAGTVEYRYPIWRTYHPEFTYGIAKFFVDVGDSFDRFDDLAIDHLKTSYGVGVMLTTPQKFLLQSQLGISEENIEMIFSLNREI